MPRGDLFSVVQSLRVFTAVQLSEILYAHSPGKYKDVHSTRVQADKWIKKNPDIEKVKRGVYRIKGCKSEGGEHSLKLSQTLTELYKIPAVEPVIFREKYIAEIERYPDALILLKCTGRGACFVLEQVNEETEEYLTAKVKEWQSWEKANDYLSQTFNYRIPHFEIVISGTQIIPRGCYALKNYLQEVMKDG